jgi:hypothetical protein
MGFLADADVRQAFGDWQAFVGDWHFARMHNSMYQYRTGMYSYCSLRACVVRVFTYLRVL